MGRWKHEIFSAANPPKFCTRQYGFFCRRVCDLHMMSFHIHVLLHVLEGQYIRRKKPTSGNSPVGAEYFKREVRSWETGEVASKQGKIGTALEPAPNLIWGGFMSDFEDKSNNTAVLIGQQ